MISAELIEARKGLSVYERKLVSQARRHAYHYVGVETWIHKGRSGTAR